MNSNLKSKAVIAVTVASHNRRELTVRCVQSLLNQSRNEKIRFDWNLFLVDDGSSDGTSDAVLNICPTAKIIRRDGTLFWAKAMALAEKEVLCNQTEFTHILWLNDDTFLDSLSFNLLLALSAKYPNSIIVGATRDPHSGKQTYGGVLRNSWHPMRFSYPGISASIQSVDSFNGNTVLFPLDVIRKTGGIDDKFSHGLADIDLGLRAKKKNIAIYQAPGTVGVCSIGQRIDPNKLSILTRWRYLESKKGVPFCDQSRFLKRHLPVVWPVILILGYLKQVLLGVKRWPRQQ